VIILGIDPALGSTGWGVIKVNGNSINYVSSGTIKTNADDLLHHRLATIYDAIEKIVLEYKPHVTAMEEVFINMNAASSIKLCHARGTIMAVIGKHMIKLVRICSK
jgi:crossover junction endodeoxyribonuclease RuvC